MFFNKINKKKDKKHIIVYMKFLKILLIIFVFIAGIKPAFCGEDYSEMKKEIIVLYNTNKIKEAYQLISKIPEKERDCELWLLAANITQDYDRTLDAIYLLQKAITTDPKNYKPYYNLGNLYLRDKKYNSAIYNYKLCLKQNKEFAYAWYNMGNAYLGLEDYPKAKSAFMRAISFGLSEPDFYYNLAFTYKKLNKKKQAEKMLKIYNTLMEQMPLND